MSATGTQERAAEVGADDRPVRPGRRRFVVALVLLLVATMVVLGIVLLVRAGQAGDDADGNQALVDQAATTQVIGEVSQALNVILSYDYRDPDASQRAADGVLVGAASGQYQTLFTQLQKSAGDQKLTLTARTVEAAVSSLSGDTASLLVFLDQRSTRASDGASSTSAAQLRITAVRQGGTWKIGELTPL